VRDRAMGVLFILSGVCFVAGVINPPLLSIWGGSVPQVVRTASAHRVAWFTSTWLIALSVVAGIAAVELLARSLDTDTARVGRSLYLVGSGLALASTIYDLSVTSTLLGTAPLPAWYLGAEHWAEGLARRTTRCWRQPRWSASACRSCIPGNSRAGPASSC
jgi:hypothetical protein